MPVQRGKDSKGPYYQWGKSGKKYYYEAGDKQGREGAKAKAEAARWAAEAFGGRLTTISFRAMITGPVTSALILPQEKVHPSTRRIAA